MLLGLEAEQEYRKGRGQMMSQDGGVEKGGGAGGEAGEGMGSAEGLRCVFRLDSGVGRCGANPGAARSLRQGALTPLTRLARLECLGQRYCSAPGSTNMTDQKGSAAPRPSPGCRVPLGPPAVYPRDGVAAMMQEPRPLILDYLGHRWVQGRWASLGFGGHQVSL